MHGLRLDRVTRLRKPVGPGPVRAARAAAVLQARAEGRRRSRVGPRARHHGVAAEIPQRAAHRPRCRFRQRARRAPAAAILAPLRCGLRRCLHVAAAVAIRRPGLQQHAAARLLESAATCSRSCSACCGPADYWCSARWARAPWSRCAAGRTAAVALGAAANEFDVPQLGAAMTAAGLAEPVLDCERRAIDGLATDIEIIYGAAFGGGRAGRGAGRRHRIFRAARPLLFRGKKIRSVSHAQESSLRRRFPPQSL